TRALLRDEVLIGIVRTSPKGPEDLGKVRGMPRPVAAQFGSEIFAAVRRAFELPPDQRPYIRMHEEGPADRFNIDALWARIQCICYEQHIDPAIIGGRQQIADFYWQRQTGKNPENHPLAIGWRKELLSPILDQK
ncbi:MAG TPA: hypothetical protein VG722_01265, partial [Tepidisphaeraceae bacterium]|nr:hypothetical protein [Tepidisphaeraceae bacterium]